MNRFLLALALVASVSRTSTASGNAPLSAVDKGVSTFPGRVVIDDAARTVSAYWDDLPREGAPRHVGRGRARVAYGKAVVKNKSGLTVDVYGSLNDATTDWYFVATVPSGYKFTMKRLPRRVAYLVAAELAGVYDGFWDWGPQAFTLFGSKFVWTLY